MIRGGEIQAYQCICRLVVINFFHDKLIHAYKVRMHILGLLNLQSPANTQAFMHWATLYKVNSKFFENMSMSKLSIYTGVNNEKGSDKSMLMLKR